MMNLIFDMVVKGQEVGGEHKAFVRGLSLHFGEQTTRESCRVPSPPWQSLSGRMVVYGTALQEVEIFRV